MKMTNKLLTFMLLAMPAVYGEQIAEKQIITEYIISADEFKKLKNLEDLKKYKGSESIVYNQTASSNDIIRGKNIVLLGNDINIDAEKTHNEILGLLLENSKKIKNIDNQKINFLINALKIQETAK
ncbi:MAG: hypothetical protein D8H92_01030 [Campylobacter sp.]|jgi:hypothetical protein|nr:MAG: hypothetical protein D8H92_01030 [Campylobacter sp.]